MSVAVNTLRLGYMLSFLRVLSLGVKTVEQQEIIKRPLIPDTQMF